MEQLKNKKSKTNTNTFHRINVHKTWVVTTINIKSLSN
jgi:hypothetical protein